MPVSPTLLSTLTLLFSVFTGNANAGFRMELDVLITARMDPLVSPNGIASVSSIKFIRYTDSDGFLVIASMFTI